jgi:carbonic anhydrase
MKSACATRLFALVAGLFPVVGCAEFKGSVASDVSASRPPLDRLMDGNARFESGKTLHPNQSVERRNEEAKTQHPFAVIVSCSDSRVSPELVFDQGIGDLFVVRTAGNRLDDLELASIEYAIDHLHCPLVVVLGHERCGAVGAAIEAESGAGADHGHDASAVASHIPELVKALHDAVVRAKGKPGDALDNTVVANIRIVTAQLPVLSPMVGEHVKAGTVKVIGLRYDLDTGAVTAVDA